MLTTKQAVMRMKADIQLRGLSKNTMSSYLTHAEIFLNYCEKPAQELDEKDVRRFLGHLINGSKHTPATINNYSAAIRFFFAVTLNRTMNYLQIPRMKAAKTLPEVITKDEASELINNCRNIKHRALLLLAYGSGLRVNEIACLRIRDIDSETMRVFVNGGKGKKDRYTLLSENTLLALRKYWREYRPKSKDGWLFPGIKNVGHITTSAIACAVNTALKGTVIAKNVTPHTLRHAFATHLLENGLSLLQIKELLGHYSIQSTTVYLHLANTTQGIISPAEHIKTPIFEDVDYD